MMRKALLLFFTALPAFGQAIEEIQITAERRSTDIQKTALAITALGEDQLEKSNVTELADLNGMVPSLEITKSSGFETIVTIRGVGSETPENAPTTTPGVSLFIDGVYIANTVSLDQTLFDLDHVEVLRGPQGALYGQSSIGGAINLVTRQPELGNFGGNADFTAGNYALFRERAEVNLPLGSDWAVRASVQKYDHDGFAKTTEDVDDAHDASGKLAVLWRPTDNFSATLTGQWYSADQNGAAQKNILDPNPDPRVLSQDYPSKFNLDTRLYHLNLDWDLPWFEIKSVSAYQGLDHRQKEDSSRSTFDQLGIYDDVAAWNTGLQNYNEELDFLSHPGGALDWVGGVFALSQKSTQFVVEFQGTDANPDLSIPANVETSPPNNVGFGNYTLVRRKSYSPFAQATWHASDALRLTLGGRFNYDSYKLDSLNFAAFGISDVHNLYQDHVLTGRAELDYDLTANSLLYASLTRGYKPGGVNSIAGQVVVPNSFKVETNTAYEVGSKNLMLDNHLRANLAAFYYVYRNQQYIEADPVPFDAGMANIPSTHVWGGEAEVSYLALRDKLRLNANLTAESGAVQGNYKTIDSTLLNAIENSNPLCLNNGAYFNPGCWAAVIASSRSIGGNQPAKMPRYAGSANVSYSYGTLTPRIEYVYRGALWSRLFAEPGLDRVKAYGLVNFNLLYQPEQGDYTLSLTATNLLNTAGVNSRYTDPYGTGQTSQEYVPPRQVMGTVSYSF
jgi:iron complex outermembrane receptor protein